MTEKEMRNEGSEMVDCFFCGKKNAVEFVDGKGPAVLGERKNGKDFGAHAHCGCLRNPRN